MNIKNIIRAWKDEDYRLSLSDADRAKLPANPAGQIELTDNQLKSVAGGYSAYTHHCATVCSDCTHAGDCITRKLGK